MIKSRMRLIWLLVGCVVVLTGACFLLNYLFFDQPATPPADPPKVLENGEYYIPSGNVHAVYPYLSASDVTAVQVYNHESNAPYSIVLTEKNQKKTYRLQGYEGLQVQSNLLSMVLTYCSMPDYTQRVTDGTNTDTIVYQNGQSRPASLKQYGLDEQSDPIWVKITLKDGTTHQLFLGDMTPMGEGYYCRYVDANGNARKEIYVVSVMFSYLTLPKEAYLTPTIVQTNASSSYPYLPRIRITERGQVKVEATFIADNYGEASGNLYLLSQPVAANGYQYAANASVLTKICSDFISLTGNQVVSLLPTGADRTDEAVKEIFDKYGLNTTGPQNRYMLEYGLTTGAEEGDDPLGGVEEDSFLMFPLLFSEKQKNEEGKDIYYVYCMVLGEDDTLYEQIVEADASKFEYLEQDSVYYVEPEVYSNSVAQIQAIEYQGWYRDENGTMRPVSELFYLEHHATDQSGTDAESGKNAYYSVTCQNSGYQYQPGAVSNFSSLYLLTIYNPMYLSTVTDADMANAELMATIKITQKDGKIFTFTYYQISSCKVAVSVNGAPCEFAVSYTAMNELMFNVTRAQNGLHAIVRATSQLAGTPGIEAK